MPGLIVTDLDGTVLRSDKTISLYTAGVFKACQKEGLLTAVATARHPLSMEEYLKALTPNFEISTDGTMIRERTASAGNKYRLLHSWEFTAEEGNQLISGIFREEPDSKVTVVTRNSIVRGFRGKLATSVLKLVAVLQDEEKARRLGEKYGCQIIGYRGENRYSFICQGAGKRSAVEWLTQYVSVSLKDVIAFGDDTGDVQMLKACGRGVAVENGIKEAKDAAGELAGRNDEDGPARWLEKHILKASNLHCRTN